MDITYNKELCLGCNLKDIEKANEIMVKSNKIQLKRIIEMYQKHLDDRIERGL
jgi:hypothetical protein